MLLWRVLSTRLLQTVFPALTFVQAQRWRVAYDKEQKNTSALAMLLKCADDLVLCAARRCTH